MKKPRLRFTSTAAGIIVTLLTATSTLAATPGDTRVTNDQGTPRYVSAEQLGGTGAYTDATLIACGQNRRQQNEPAIATDPSNSTIMTSGSNDYCTVPTAGGTWTGYYYSKDSGRTWVDSLLPGYPTDTSPEGQASPLRQRGITNAGDPVQSWDTQGRLFYMGNAFNRAQPQNASVWVATYEPGSNGDGSRYVRTVLVGQGTPALNGRFNDKTAIQVDQGVNSPYRNNVYAAWSLFEGKNGNNSIQFTHSTDHGATFSQQIKLSETVKDSQFADIAVTSDGAVYVVWREFASNRGHEPDAIVYVVSHDGGQTFTKPATAQTFTPYDPQDQYGNPAAAAAVEREAFAGDAGDAAGGSARDCGDSALACTSGYTFFRQNSQVRVTADPTGQLPGVYIAYNASKPGTETPTGNTYGTIVPGTGSQSAVYVKNLLGGAPTLIDNEAQGHQFFADIDANSGKLHAVWYDSRVDPAYSPARPVGNYPNGASSGPSLEAYYASSTNGTTWTPGIAVSSQPHNPNYEMFGDRQVPFHGDYLYISAVGGTVGVVWTDNRNVVPGKDPREGAGDRDDSGPYTDDVLQCRTPLSSGGFGPDTCPNSGGLDQNIYARTIINGVPQS